MEIKNDALAFGDSYVVDDPFHKMKISFDVKFEFFRKGEDGDIVASQLGEVVRSYHFNFDDNPPMPSQHVRN